MSQTNLIFLFCGFAIYFNVASVQAQSPVRKPNILLIVADDMGYAEMGCQGSTDVPTPHIDSLARNGVRCTSGYVSCPVCSPSRAGLLTGRYQQRFGHEFNPGHAGQFGLPLREVTLANRLKSIGYATGTVGKWHLGYQPRYHPEKRGFDEYFGFLGGAHSYVDVNADQSNPKWLGATIVERPGYLTDEFNRLYPILRGTKKVVEPEYLTDAFTREAVAFIDRHQREPFFLYLSFNAVHDPLQATQRYLDRFVSIKDTKRRTFAAMLSGMDDGIGAVLAKLRQSDLEGDTLIFFVSDNGGPTPQTCSRNDPLSGFKGQVLEGGIRVPFIVQWKGHLPSGKVYEPPVIALDILPTAVAAGGGKQPTDTKLDGVDLLPYLTGLNKQPPHEMLFWRYGSQLAVRKGRWKLARINDGPVELFDLFADIGEKTSLAEQKPEKLKELEIALKEWEGQLTEPRWQSGQK